MVQFSPVTSSNYPYVQLSVKIRDWQDNNYALIDTGFTGNLVVPVSLLSEAMGLPDSRIQWELADGSVVGAPVYLGTLEILGLPPIRDVAITFLGEEFILGRGIIDRYKVTFDHGEKVILEI